MNSETIYNSITDIDPELIKKAGVPRRQKLLKKVIPIAAAAAVVIAGIFILRYEFFVKSVSTIYVTINPSLSISMNRAGGAVSVDALNEDAVVLLEGYVYTNKSGTVVTSEIIQKAEEMGYLTEDGTATISIEAENETEKEKINEDLTNEIKGAEKVAKKININIRSMLTDTEAKAAAMEFFGLESAELKSIKCTAEHDSAIYRIKLTSGGKIYDCEMDAVTGEIITDMEYTEPEGTDGSSKIAVIDGTQAEDIALSDFGVTRDDVTYIHNYNENDGADVVGIWVEFGYNNEQYKYLIDITSGEIAYRPEKN